MSRTAVLLDIDGTLLDSNYLHALAWRRAFLDLGRNVPTAWMHHRIGMSARMLLQDLLGADQDAAAAAKEAHRRHFDALKPELRRFDGARELLRDVHDRGPRVVLATSADTEHELPALLEVLDAGDSVDAVTSGEDVEDAKPDPDVFLVAAGRVGVDPAACVAVGDTVWDIKAARRAGMGCVTVLTGGIGREELLAAGALAVYRDVLELRSGLDTSPLGRLW